MVWLPDVEKILEDIFIRFDRIHKHDRQTDVETLHECIGRTYTQRCAAKIV